MGFFGGAKKGEDGTTVTASTPPQKAATPGRPGAVGIDHAIKLLRVLPKEHPELVVSVVKTTLESVNISVDEIVADGNKRLEEISALQKEVEKRSDEIKGLEIAQAETAQVKERLERDEFVVPIDEG